MATSLVPGARSVAQPRPLSTLTTPAPEAEIGTDDIPLAAERVAGSDAVFLHMERPDTPTHTLKVLVLDPARRGRPVTLEDVAAVLPRYLGLVRRSTQRLETVRGFGGKPFWVRDERFDVRAHLDETWAAEPGGREALDAICAELATRQLDRSRPLWAMTLVHGLAGGRQAIVVRVHHAVMDGIAALNTFRAATTEEPGVLPAEAPASAWISLDPAVLRREAVNGVRSGLVRSREFMRAHRDAARATKAFGDRSELPSGLVQRTTFNTPSGARRACASASLDFADVRRLAGAAGITVNGALHAVIARAMQADMHVRGERIDAPLVAIFGVAEDTQSTRRYGNRLATARAFLRVDLSSPEELLHATARSCLLAVDLRRRRGFALHRLTQDLTGRLAPSVRAVVADAIPRVANHITTANVPGPQRRRWLGDVEVVDWISYALAIAPADVNLTAYSYAGRLSIGLVVTPESMPDPVGFLRRVRAALEELLAAVAVDQEDGLKAS